jgi:hypothetical protein
VLCALVLILEKPQNRSRNTTKKNIFFLPKSQFFKFSLTPLFLVLKKMKIENIGPAMPNFIAV